MKDASYWIEGVCPMLMHNGRLANPLNPHSQRIKVLAAKRKKTEEDILALARAEFDGGLFWEEGPGYVIPGHNIGAAMIEGARKTKNGRQVESGAFPKCDAVLSFEGSDKSPDELWEGGKHALLCTCGVGTRRVLRTRPMIPTGWRARVDVQYDENQVEEPTLFRALEDCGVQVGIGDWRPKYGRFTVRRA
jgi:hypothetical protein